MLHGLCVLPNNYIDNITHSEDSPNFKDVLTDRHLTLK